MNRARHWATLLLAAGLALALASSLAACGGSADDNPPSAAPTQPPAAVTSTPPAETAQASIVTPDPPVPEASTPTDEPTSTAPAASEPVAAPGEPSTPTAESPAPEAEALPLLYDTFDLSSAVAEPGHYVFLADPADTGTAVTTYEGLRDGTTTALLIHTADGRGVSHADLYDAVAPGDLVEWKQADDCFVRYQVTEVQSDPTGPAQRKLFGVAWMTYAFTGCSGPIAADTAATLDWGELPDLGGTSLTAPIRHGPFQIVPETWTGATEEVVRRDPPAYNRDNPVYATTLAAARQLPYWREPAVPSGLVLLDAEADPEQAVYGYSSAWVPASRQDGVHLIIAGGYVIFHALSERAAWRPNGDDLGVRETRVIAGRPAQVIYSPAGPTHQSGFPATVWIYDPATSAVYSVHGVAPPLLGNVESLITIARSLFAHPPTLLVYDTFDLSGAVTEPGHYAFLADPADPGSAVHTYEELRDGTAAALLVHTHDAHGISQAARYDAVAAGDLFEWRQADDCFVRYQVTSAPAPAAGAVIRSFGVAWMTYAFTGCSGPIDADTAATLDWGELPDLGGTSLTAPIIHGRAFQIVPAGWTGEVFWTELISAPSSSYEAGGAYTEDLTTAQTLPYWRDLPGWTLESAQSGGPSDPILGYCAFFKKGEHTVSICGGHAGGLYGRPSAVDANGNVVETRVIAGYPVVVDYLPAGLPLSQRGSRITAYVYEPADGSLYEIFGRTNSLSGTNVDALLNVVRTFLSGVTP